jgi:hypothetical protein
MPGCRLLFSRVSSAEFTRQAQTQADPCWHPPYEAEGKGGAIIVGLEPGATYHLYG